MGRGQETNLLYNPPSIKSRKKRTLGRERQGFFERSIADLVIARNEPGEQSFVVSRGHEGDLRFLDEDLKEIRHHEQNITDDALLVASGSNIAWGDGEGFALRRKDDPENPLSFRTGSGGEILALHLDDQHLYCLRHEQGTASDTVLEKISLEDFDNLDASWETVKASSGPVAAIRKGEKTVLWFAASDSVRESPPQLITLNDQGLDPNLNLSSKRALLDSVGDPLVTPGKEGGEYFIVSPNEEGSSTLHHLQNTSWDRQNGGNHSQSREIALLGPREGVRGQRVEDILWLGDKGMILTDEELLLFDASGLLENLRLNKSSDLSYDRLSSIGDKVLLWKRGDAAYLEVSL